MNLKGVMHVKNESDKKSDKKDDKSKKALFVQRLIAFLIDSAIVVFAASLIATPFINSDKILLKFTRTSYSSHNKVTSHIYIPSYKY